MAPRATYRLQFRKGFTFRSALEIVPYLADLGISHVYASPILKARPGSPHGYDIADHQQLNPEIGTLAEFNALVEALHGRGMGLVLDVVPNHMGVGGKDNPWWLDVLEWGEDSPFARFFDVDWKSGGGKILLPVLGDQYGKILAGGGIRLAFDPSTGTFSAWYYDHRFPVDPREYGCILNEAAADAVEALGPLALDFGSLKTVRSSAEVRHHGNELKRSLAALAARMPHTEKVVSDTLARWRGKVGDLESWGDLHALLERQSYRAAYWRVAADEINYRRFFNINDLAGIRVELPEVFEETHRLVFGLVDDGAVDGLRIDHIDGLFDPEEYCGRVRARFRPGRPAYVAVEKILAPAEQLCQRWPVAGTTGYEALNLISNLFVDPRGKARLERFYRRFCGRTENFDTVLYASKKRIMQVDLASEMTVLAKELHRLSSTHLLTRDFTLNGLHAAIEEVLANFPVFRTYVTAEKGASPQDRSHIGSAVARARVTSDAPDASVFDFLEAVLTGNLAQQSGYVPEEVFRVAMHAQQLSGPVMAKGMEDTAFYRHFPLLSLNEVGGDPRRFGLSLAAFHSANRARLERWPDAMTTTSTHDTKRGEDARARIHVLSEMAKDWTQRVTKWSRLNRLQRMRKSGRRVPDPNDEYLFYQTLLGAWPLDLDPHDAAAMATLTDRIDAFMRKALREGKERSSWDAPHEAYEEELSSFVRRALEVSSTNQFLVDFASFANRIGRWGAITGLAQTLLKLTIPGVPDFYQGSELWDQSLVDPDNRRAVDYAARARMLATVRERLSGDSWAAQTPLSEGKSADWDSGRQKLGLIETVLRTRREHPELFARGHYRPLGVQGSKADHVCAFMRESEKTRCIVVVIRFLARLHAGETGPSAWADTGMVLPVGRYRNLFDGIAVEGSGEAVPLEKLLAHFPLAFMVPA